MKGWALLAWQVGNPGFGLQQVYKADTVVHACDPALGRKKQENQEFKVTLQ